MAHFDVIITKEGKRYVSWCPQVDVASSGDTIEKARENLKEAIELYLEDEDAKIPPYAGSVTLTSIEVKENGKTARAFRA
jgi:predicted RNase H-like HicB family nuclease